MMMLNPNQLKVDGKAPVHNIWFFKFCDMFDEVIDRVRFIELRPKEKWVGKKSTTYIFILFDFNLYLDYSIWKKLIILPF